MLTKELTAASTRPLLLSILEQGESYGYSLVQQVKELSGGKIEWNEGTLYPVLHRLEEEGLIECEWKDSPSGKQRKYYRLRKTGKLALAKEKEQWVAVNATLNKIWTQTPRLAWSTL